jgi:hypothetical protein
MMSESAATSRAPDEQLLGTNGDGPRAAQLEKKVLVAGYNGLGLTRAPSFLAALIQLGLARCLDARIVDLVEDFAPVCEQAPIGKYDAQFSKPSER